MLFVKTDYANDEEEVETTIEAQDLETLLKNEKKAYEKSGVLEPCHGRKVRVKIKTDEDGTGWLEWNPGTGESVTLADYRPN